MKINLTIQEAEALWQTAGQMRDDFIDYYSFMPLKKRNKFHDAYTNGMNKLLQVMQSGKQNVQASVATEANSSNTADKPKIKK